MEATTEPTARASNDDVSPEQWERLKALVLQFDNRLGLPMSYNRLKLADLNDKQLVKVKKVISGVSQRCCCIIRTDYLTLSPK